MQRQLDQYNLYWSEGKPYLALKATEPLFNVFESLSNTEKAYIKSCFVSHPISGDLFVLIEKEAQHDLSRIHRIIMVGENFDSDEILLVLTIRNWLDTLVVILKQMYSIDLVLPFNEVDPTILQMCLHVRMAKKSRQLFHKLFSQVI